MTSLLDNLKASMERCKASLGRPENCLCFATIVICYFFASPVFNMWPKNGVVSWHLLLIQSCWSQDKLLVSQNTSI